MNRREELAALRSWWDTRQGALGLVWGRRRVGKTALLQEFGRSRRMVFHTAAGRPVDDELAHLSFAAAPFVGGVRDLGTRPFRDWDEALDSLAQSAAREPLLLVLDEFPELVTTTPELPGVLRAFWDRARSASKLRILLSGSAVRTMTAIQEARAPLYGRLDLALLVHPFRPHEAAAMLPRLTPPERAAVWGLLGGVPLYLEWWDQDRGLKENLHRLACRPGGLLLTEGQFVLATEVEGGDLPRLVLHAIAAGRTKYHEIADAVRAEPARTLERLIELRLVERVAPVTEDERRHRRRLYRIADNFLAFWLGVLDRHRAEIDRGLGKTILPTLMGRLDDHLGPRWEEAFRLHLRRLAGEGALGPDVVAVGPFWRDGGDEIDAVVLAGRERAATLVGEAKWARSVDARRIRGGLERKASALPATRGDLRYAVCARERVTHADGVLAVTAADVFTP